MCSSNSSNEMRQGAHVAGFTLLELLVVLFIVGLASSLVFMAVGRTMLFSEKKMFVKRFAAALSQARAKSLGQGRIITFLIYGDDRAYGILDGEKTSFPEEVEVRGDGIMDFTEGIYAIEFFPDGSSTGGTITLSWPDGLIYSVEIGKFFGVVRIRHREG